jgi:AcrR family transcriptional regulator
MQGDFRLTGPVTEVEAEGAPVEGRSPRARDASATRGAILEAAQRLFTKLGYDGAGMREIAGEAGVDARLIGRYFGSKERLFAEVIAVSYRKTLMMTPGVNHEAATALLAPAPAAALDGMLLTIRSASNERAAEVIRANLEANYQRELAAALDGPDAEGRAALLVAICTGVQFIRNVLGSTVLGGTTLGAADTDAADTDTADTDAADTDAADTALVGYLEAALDAVAVARPAGSESPSTGRRARTEADIAQSADSGRALPGDTGEVGARDLRSAVVDAAARLLAAEGPSGLAIRRVAAEAGCSTMVVYHYFQGKQGLLDAVHAEGFARLTAAQRLAETGTETGTGTGTEGAEAEPLRVCRSHRAAALANPAYYRVMFAQPVPGGRPSADSRRYARRAEEQLVEAVRRWSGGLPLAVDLPSAAHVLWATGHGLVMLELAGHAPPGDPAAGYDAALGVTLRGLRS